MKYYKIMVTVRSNGILWDLKERCAADKEVFDGLNTQIDIEDWKNKYIDLYQKWLEEDDDTLYQIESKINMDMIQSLVKLNNQNHEFKVFYWFDVDRDKYPGHKWLFCPLTSEPLINLHEGNHKNNSKISPRFPLIFPEIDF